MARKTYHRSNKLKILALVAAMAVLGVLVAVYVGYRQLTSAPEQLVASIVEDAKLSLGKIQQTATRDGRTEWRLDAASARYLESDNQVQLTDLTVTFYMESGQQVRLSANDGLLNTESNDIEVSGDVRVKNEDYTLSTATLHYRHQQRVIFSNAPVVINRNAGGQLSADALRLDLNTNRVLLEGNVTGDFDEPEPSPKNRIRVQARKLIADIDGDTAEFIGNVRLDRGATRITADYSKLYYNRKEGPGAIGELDESAVEKIEARGKVRIRHQDILARADTAVYETGAETLILDGRDTTVTRGAHSIRGTRMVLRRGGEHVSITGDPHSRVKAVIAAGSGLF